MRTLFVVPHDEEFGGVASVFGNLARHLQNRGHEVIFLHQSKAVFLKPKTTKWGFPGFEIRMQLPFGARHTVGTRHPVVSLIFFLLLFPVTMYQLIRLIKRHRIQIVNIHYPTDRSFYCAICRWILPIKLITSVHGADILLEGRRKVRYSRAIRFLLFSSDLIVTVSRAFQKHFLSIFPDLQGKTVFIHNGVDLAELSENSENGTGGEQGQYVLCIAAHYERKGLDVLIHAVSSLNDVDLPFKLLLVGDGPLREQLEDLAVSLGVHERIEFLGKQGRGQVAKLLHCCDVFVQPSRSETFGIAIIEAMACKKPVVATRVGGIPEIIENGKNGILVEPDNPDALAEAIMTVLKNKDLKEAIANNGYATVQERFRYENTGSAYESVFGGLLS